MEILRSGGWGRAGGKERQVATSVKALQQDPAEHLRGWALWSICLEQSGRQWSLRGGQDQVGPWEWKPSDVFQQGSDVIWFTFLKDHSSLCSTQTPRNKNGSRKAQWWSVRWFRADTMTAWIGWCGRRNSKVIPTPWSLRTFSILLNQTKSRSYLEGILQT